MGFRKSAQKKLCFCALSVIIGTETFGKAMAAISDKKEVRKNE